MGHPIGEADVVPALCVVIPTTGRASLHDQLESLAACSWDRSWEIVVADNGPEQLAATVCAAWADELPHLRHVDASQRPGRASAVNCGARAARAPALVFVDDDDLVVEHFVATIGNALAAGAPVVVFNLDVRTLNDPAVWKSYGYEELEDGRPMFRSIPAVWGCAGIDRQLFLALGGFDETFGYAEDLEFSVRLHDTVRIEPLWIHQRLLLYRLRTTFAARFHQQVAVRRSIGRLASRYPEVLQLPERDRWRGLFSDVVRSSPTALRSIDRQRRLELAGQLGAAWGRFTSSGPWRTSRRSSAPNGRAR